jgi:hypothetical protein
MGSCDTCRWWRGDHACRVRTTIRKTVRTYAYERCGEYLARPQSGDAA